MARLLKRYRSAVAYQLLVRWRLGLLQVQVVGKENPDVGKRRSACNSSESGGLRKRSEAMSWTSPGHEGMGRFCLVLGLGQPGHDVATERAD